MTPRKWRSTPPGDHDEVERLEKGDKAKHVAIGIDHKEAHIFDVDADKIDAEIVTAPRHLHHRHPKGAPGGGDPRRRVLRCAVLRLFAAHGEKTSMQEVIGTRPAQFASSTRGPARLLVVDDEPDTCEAMRILLEMKGYDVTTTTKARQALAGVVTESYDLVLADIAMPGTDGITLCQEVAGLRPTLPVMLITGRSDTATLTRALRAGARDFLTKPLDTHALLSAVARLLGHQSERAAPSDVVVEGHVKPFEVGLACLVGESEEMQEVRKLILDLSPTLCRRLARSRFAVRGRSRQAPYLQLAW